MYEVELKVRADHAAVRDRLADAGADRTGAVVQADTYYDAPDRSFADTDEALRIRRVRRPEGDRHGADDGGHDDGSGDTDGSGAGDDGDGDGFDDSGRDGDGFEGGTGATPAEWPTVRVTYKGPKVDDASKTREEAETAVADGERMDAILRGLGYDPVATVRKRRETYALDGYTVTLDAVDGLGEFVEVETEVDDRGAVDAAREGAADRLASLGLDAGEGIRRSYLGLLLDDAGDPTAD